MHTAFSLGHPVSVHWCSKTLLIIDGSVSKEAGLAWLELSYIHTATLTQEISIKKCEYADVTWREGQSEFARNYLGLQWMCNQLSCAKKEKKQPSRVENGKGCYEGLCRPSRWRSCTAVESSFLCVFCRVGKTETLWRAAEWSSTSACYVRNKIKSLDSSLV